MSGWPGRESDPPHAGDGDEEDSEHDLESWDEDDEEQGDESED